MDKIKEVLNSKKHIIILKQFLCIPKYEKLYYDGVFYHAIDWLCFSFQWWVK